jgi:hypothetical protein
VLTGIAIEYHSAAAGFLLAALFSVLLGFVCCYRNGNTLAATTAHEALKYCFIRGN